MAFLETKGNLFYGELKISLSRKSTTITTGLLPRDKGNSKRRNKLLKVNSYLNNFCKNKKNMLLMVQGEGWILHENVLDESLY